MRRLKTLFKENAEILALSGAANRLADLQRIWDSIVPPPLRPFARPGGVRHRRIVVFADNGSVAAKLKLLAPSLLKNLQNKGVDVTSIRIEVQVISRPRPPQRAPRKPGQQAVESLQTLAGQLPDSPLGTALSRLVRHVQER